MVKGTCPCLDKPDNRTFLPFCNPCLFNWCTCNVFWNYTSQQPVISSNPPIIMHYMYLCTAHLLSLYMTHKSCWVRLTWGQSPGKPTCVINCFLNFLSTVSSWVWSMLQNISWLPNWKDHTDCSGLRLSPGSQSGDLAQLLKERHTPRNSWSPLRGLDHRPLLGFHGPIHTHRMGNDTGQVIR